ncbi:MAG: Enoyl-CoA hydratase/isomerase [Myxococcaceae bacterium]|nr:Enoyl-CoA hydratase/isomerase [Myxococcaceae bacterium]
MTDPTLTIETRGRVLAVGLSRAAKRNAFNLQMLRELAAAYGRLEDDPELRCLVLFAHGDHFTAGLDLGEVGPHVAAGGELHVDGGVDPLDLAGRRRKKPVVMAVQGYCYTIGVELALAADVVVASRDAKFTQFEVRRGIMPFGGATLRFAQTAGYQNAMRYVLTGDAFDADEARRIGVVQEVTDPGQQVARAMALAETIAAQAPLAVQAARANAKLCLEQGHAAAYARLMPEARALMASEDASEGLRSFVERREAVFHGR